VGQVPLAIAQWMPDPPRLDRFGNSVRGTDVCIDLASRLGPQVFDCVNVGSSFLDAIL